MWFYLFCFWRNSFNPSNQVWWILKCGKSMKEKLCSSTFSNSLPCLIKCSRFPRLCLDSHRLNGESDKAQCVPSPRSPWGRKSSSTQTGYYGHLWSHFPLSHPQHLFHSRDRNDTWPRTPVCVITAQKQILCTLRSPLNVWPSPPHNRAIGTRPNALPRESWESGLEGKKVQHLSSA